MQKALSMLDAKNQTNKKQEAKTKLHLTSGRLSLPDKHSQFCD